MKLHFMRLLKNTYGPISGLLSVIVYSIGIIISYILFTGFDFNCMVSWLGGEYSPGAIFFNVGVFLSGLFAIPFFIYLHKRTKAEVLNKQLRMSAIFLALSSCLFFSLIGLFPSLLYNFTFYIVHGIVFSISMITGIAYLLIYSIIFFKSKNFKKILSYIGFTIIVTMIIFLFTWIPIFEWLMTFAIIFWMVFVSTYLLVKK